MCIPWGKTFSLVPRSRSSVKVKCQGHNLKKIGCCGGIPISQTHLVRIFSKCQKNIVLHKFKVVTKWVVTNP